MSHVKKRFEYIDRIQENRRSPNPLTEVYLDESYFHEHDREELTYVDPTDEQDTMPRLAHKGKRVCFQAAIIAEDMKNNTGTMCVYSLILLQEPHVIAASINAFVSQKEDGDYHGNFDDEMFHKWFCEMLCMLNTLLATNYEFSACAR